MDFCSYKSDGGHFVFLPWDIRATVSRVADSFWLGARDLSQYRLSQVSLDFIGGLDWGWGKGGLDSSDYIVCRAFVICVNFNLRCV